MLTDNEIQAAIPPASAAGSLLPEPSPNGKMMQGWADYLRRPKAGAGVFRCPAGAG